MPDLPEDVDDDDMMEQHWPPRGQNRGQRKQQSDMNSNENSESMESGGDQLSSVNLVNEQKNEQSIANDISSSPTNEYVDGENLNGDEKQDRMNRQRPTRNNQQQQQIENRSRRYYEGNNANNQNNRRANDRDRSTWQDRTTNSKLSSIHRTEIVDFIL